MQAEFHLENYFQASPIIYTREGLPAFFGDTFQGRPAFIVAGGPSFLQIDHIQLAQPGCLTMGINNAVKACRTDLWVSIGDPTHFMKSIWLDPKMMKFTSIAYIDSVIFDNEVWKETNIKVRECPNVYFFQPNGEFSAEDFLLEDTVNCGNTADLGGGRSSMLPALRLLFYLGVREVYLLGVDFSMSANAKYYFEQDVPEGGIRSNRRIYELLRVRLAKLRSVFKENGFHVFNCNADSALKVFPFVDFDTAVARCRKDMPVSHSMERTAGLYDRHIEIAEELRIEGGNTDSQIPSLLRPADVKPVKTKNAGVVVGSNKTTEWLLPWWFENFREHNQFPVEFSDFGMSSQAREWCSERGTVTDIPSELPDFRKEWLKKPFALSASNFDKILWMDIDCEVRGNLGPVFELIADDLVLGHDIFLDVRYEEIFLRHLFFNAGVIGLRKTPAQLFIIKWCERCLKEHHKYRGDQEILNAILYEDEMRVVSLHPKYNRLRLQGDVEDAVVMHWTGPKGKEVIRSQIEGWGTSAERHVPAV